jgi:hypothetical protein
MQRRYAYCSAAMPFASSEQNKIARIQADRTWHDSSISTDFEVGSGS